MVSFFKRRFGRHANDERLIMWLDGELALDDADRVALHLDACGVCQRRFEELSQSLRLVEERRELVRKAEGCVPDLPRKFELRLREAMRERETASANKGRTFRMSRRIVLAAALSGLCLTLAVAMPGDRARALFHQIWDPVLQGLSTSGGGVAKPSGTALPISPVRQPAPVPNHAILPPTAPVVRPSRPSLAEREIAEVDARYALHGVRACMGEQIDYSQDDKGYVLVRGLVDTAARKRELENGLIGIRWLHIRIRTVEESLRAASSSFRSTSHTVTGTPTPPAAASNPERRKLEVPKGMSQERVIEISRQAVASSSLSMRHAWAVRHIAGAYTDERLARLPAESRGKLMSMLMDHAAEWQQALATLRENVSPILKSGLSGSDKTAVSIDNLFARAEEIDALTRSFFADSDGPSIDPLTASPAFYSKLSTLETALTRPQIMSSLFAWGHCAQRPGVCWVEASR